MDLKQLVSQMTLEEKAGLCSGSDFWHTKAVERLNIPAIMVSDGPYGLRKQSKEGDHLALNESIVAVCFPAGSTAASSFDRDLIHSMGEALGDECQAEEVSVLLGPAVNIKRSPLCGRNFEYFSEDPYLAGEISTSYIQGVQSKGVGTSIKHFLANNQEYRRMSSSSEVDERTLREIYMPAFESAVRNAQPWTVMCSYNKINGTYASENETYLTKVLREEWGFEGFVVSDWGAVNDRVAGVKAGLDLEMPSSGGANDAKIVKAVKDGVLEEAVLDQAVTRILNIVYKALENKKQGVVFDKDGHHLIAKRVAMESMVLLKNDNMLPLKKEESIAFIGKFAEQPRFQGGGSSHINAYKTVSALEAVKDITNVSYAKGYEIQADRIDEELLKQAVEVAKAADKAVIFAGLPDAFESEGYDRAHMMLPNCQTRLIEAVSAVQPNTIVVLHNGSPIEMPWINQVKGVLEVYLGGEAVGDATVDILFGKANPCGRLPETFPLKLEDNPSYLNFPGEKDIVEYKEGVFVGYRYYDKKKMEVLFPFGHGLSYTTFAYSNLMISEDHIKDTNTLTVKLDVTNQGAIAGKEVVQLYIAPQQSSVIRPVKELKGFEKVYLEPGQTKTVTFTLTKRSFAYFNTRLHDWHVESGCYEILIGRSSRDIVCGKAVQVESTVKVPEKFTLNSTFGDILAIQEGRDVLQPILSVIPFTQASAEADEEVTRNMMEAMVNFLPLRALVSFSNGAIQEDAIQAIVDQLNQ